MSVKNKNICKFITTSASEGLETLNFIYESNRNAMETESVIPYHRAILVTEGEGAFYADGEPFSAKVGDLIFMFRLERVKAIPGGELNYMYISFTGARAETLFHRLGISKRDRRFSGNEGLIPFWRESLSRADESTVDLASESALLYAMSRIGRALDKSDSVLARATELLEESFDDPDFDLSALASELGYNKKYLSRAFKQKMGLGITEYLRDLRIKHAVFLLEHGIDSVKNVAYLSGFRDPLYFSSVFKNTVGVSPKDYKNSRTKEKE